MAYKQKSPIIVAEGGTGAQTLTSHGVLLGNTTSAITATAAGTTGQVLTGVTGSAPTFQSPAASSISITGDTGGALSGNAFTFTGGTTGLSFGGSGSTETVSGTLVIANGGTNATSMATNTGIVKYDGTRLVTSSTAKIDSSNRTTNTSQPCFFASTAASLTNKTGDATVYTVVYDTVVFDQNSNFSSTTFTAPVTGKYQLTYSATVNNLSAADTLMILQIRTTARNYVIAQEAPFPASNANQITRLGTVIADMTAGDTATTIAYVSGSTKTVGLVGSTAAGAAVTYFSGYLIC